MRAYKLYRLDGAGRISGAAEVIEAESDEAALAAVQSRAPAGRYELWLGRTLVGSGGPSKPSSGK